MSIRKFTLAIIAWSTLGAMAWAQTNIKRYDATAQTDYGVVYNLPRTVVEVEAIVVKTSYTPGAYQPWASKYLSVLSQPSAIESYKIEGVHLSVAGEPDPDKQYLVAFEKKSLAPFVSLGTGNIIYNINGQEEYVAPQATTLPTFAEPDRTLPSLPREFSLATTKGKQAELLASYLYEVREHKANLLSGSLEQMPKDGEAIRIMLERLEAEERRCLRLFLGDTVHKAERHVWRITPEHDDMNERTLFRFSPELGILKAESSNGTPAQLSIAITERAPELDDKELKKQSKLEGIIFNKPGAGLVSLSLGGKQLAKETLPLTQVGSIQALSKRMFNLKDSGNTAIYFDPRTGAILKVVGE